MSAEGDRHLKIGIVEHNGEGIIYQRGDSPESNYRTLTLADLGMLTYQQDLENKLAEHQRFIARQKKRGGLVNPIEFRQPNIDQAFKELGLHLRFGLKGIWRLLFGG